MSCDTPQRVCESLGLGKVGGTPVEIDHALILCRLVGLGHRSASSPLSAANPSVFRSQTTTEKSGRRNMFHNLFAGEPHRSLDSSRRVRLSTDGTGFQQV